MTGPLNVLEGPHGFEELLGKEFQVDWTDRSLDRVLRAAIKRYNDEVHTQSALEGLLELRAAHGIDGRDVDEVEIEIFRTAYEMVGGGSFGDRTRVETKEQAAHSLPYLAAVVLLDGEVWPEQFDPARIGRDDVQALLRRVSVGLESPIDGPKAVVERIDPYTRRYPDEVPCQVRVKMRGGAIHEIEKRDFRGFLTNPMSWDAVEAKFSRLARPFTEAGLRREIVAAVRELETTTAAELGGLLRRVRSRTG
jgi:2-methylcitrate dehydratase